MNNWKKYLKSYCCVFYDEDEYSHVYEYFNTIRELAEFEEKHRELTLVSVQRLWWK